MFKRLTTFFSELCCNVNKQKYEDAYPLSKFIGNYVGVYIIRKTLKHFIAINKYLRHFSPHLHTLRSNTENKRYTFS